jgi:hypothetical protein
MPGNKPHSENQGTILKYRPPAKRKRRSPLIEDNAFPVYQDYDDTSVTGLAGTEGLDDLPFRKLPGSLPKKIQVQPPRRLML